MLWYLQHAALAFLRLREEYFHILRALVSRFACEIVKNRYLNWIKMISCDYFWIAMIITYISADILLISPTDFSNRLMNLFPLFVCLFCNWLWKVFTHIMCVLQSFNDWGGESDKTGSQRTSIFTFFLARCFLVNGSGWTRRVCMHVRGLIWKLNILRSYRN